MGGICPNLLLPSFDLWRSTVLEMFFMHAGGFTLLAVAAVRLAWAGDCPRWARKTRGVACIKTRRHTSHLTPWGICVSAQNGRGVTIHLSKWAWRHKTDLTSKLTREPKHLGQHRSQGYTPGTYSDLHLFGRQHCDSRLNGANKVREEGGG